METKKIKKLNHKTNDKQAQRKLYINYYKYRNLRVKIISCNK